MTLALASFKKVYFNILSTKSLKVAGKVLYETVESKMQNYSCVLLLAVQHFKSKISDDNPVTYLGGRSESTLSFEILYFKPGDGLGLTCIFQSTWISQIMSFVHKNVPEKENIEKWLYL